MGNAPGKGTLEQALKKVKIRRDEIHNSIIKTPLKYISDMFEDVELY
jgi:hypothetical protein